MKKKASLLLATLALLCTAWIMLDDRQGIVVFQLETDVEDAIAIIQKYDLGINNYTMLPPDIPYRMYSGQYIFDKEWETPSDLKNIYWQRFNFTDEIRTEGEHAHRLMAEHLTAEGGAEEGATELSVWALRVEQHQTARENYTQNIEGCWNDNDCPGYYVLSADLYGSTVEMMKLANEPLVQYAGWAELIDDSTILTPEDQEVRHQEPLRFPFTKADPEPIDWVPNHYLVVAEPTEQDTRLLTLANRWSDQSRLAHFSRLNTNLRTGIWFTQDPENSYFDNATDIWGYPVAASDSDLPRFYEEPRNVFSGGTGLDLGVGSIRPEDITTETTYNTHIRTFSGQLENDEGLFVAQAGITRLCSWASYWCTLWGDTKPLILSKGSRHLTFPTDGIVWGISDKDLDDNLERLYLPSIQR